MREDVFHLGVKALIKNKRGKILLLKNNPKYTSGLNPPHWDLPGGRLQKDDRIEDALRREIAEEIGIKQVKIVKFFDATVSNFRIYSEKKKVGLILFTYICSVKDTTKIKLTDDEHIQLEWCAPKKAARLLSVKFSDSLAEKVSKL